MSDTFNTILAAADDVIIDALGETVTITGKGTVVGAFDDEYDETLDVQGTVPTFIYSAEDLPSLAVGDTLVRGSDSYTVRIKQPDGTGMVTLILTEGETVPVVGSPFSSAFSSDFQ